MVATDVDGTCIGRTEELDQLSQLLGAAVRSTSSAVILRGEAGIGKTVVLEEAIEALLVRHRCYDPGRRTDQRHPARCAGERCHVCELERTMRRFDSSSSSKRRWSTSPTTTLAPTRPPCRLFSALQDRSPLVVAVDDLHLLDDDTVVLLSSLLRRADRHPMVLLATMRNPGPPPSGTLAMFVERLARDQLLSLVDLDPDGSTHAGGDRADHRRRPGRSDTDRPARAAERWEPVLRDPVAARVAETGALEVDDASCRVPRPSEASQRIEG